MRRQGRILHSSFLHTTFWFDGLVTKGSFHKSSMHTGTTEKIYLLRMGLQPRVPDFLCLPHFEGKPWSKYMKGHQRSRKVHAEGQGVSVLARDQ